MTVENTSGRCINCHKPNTAIEWLANVLLTLPEKYLKPLDSVCSISCAGMCLTRLQGSTAHCANTNCWHLCSSQLPLPESTPPPSWSGPLTRGRAPCCWMYTPSTVRLTEEPFSEETVTTLAYLLLNTHIEPLVFFLRWKADNRSRVLDHRGAAGLLASSFQVLFNFWTCSMFISVYLLMFRHVDTQWFSLLQIVVFIPLLCVGVS